MIKIILLATTFILVIYGCYSIIKNKSQLLSSISFFFCIVTFVLAYFFPFSNTININNETSESTPQTYSTIQQSETMIDDVIETELIEDSLPPTTEKSGENKVEESVLSYENVINGDCDLKGSIRSNLKQKYIWYPKYNNSYGLKFYISDVNLSYYVKIENVKGEMLYEYCIDDDGITQNPSLKKDSVYTLFVEANKGTPDYTIEIRYPDNDYY